jgi:hypothetical protein
MQPASADKQVCACGVTPGADAAEEREKEKLSQATLCYHQVGGYHRIWQTLFFRNRLGRYQWFWAPAPPVSLYRHHLDAVAARSKHFLLKALAQGRCLSLVGFVLN